MSPISWTIDDTAMVRTLTLDDAEVVFRAVDENRDRLRPYMPWEETTRSPDDVRAFIERSLAAPTGQEGNGIWVGEEFAGTVGLSVDPLMNGGSIGYWVARAFEGQGLVSNTCRLFIDHGFRVLKLHRIEIHAAADNRRSRAVAERLGFTHEATTRDGHRRAGDVYVDEVVYGLLDDEWLTT